MSTPRAISTREQAANAMRKIGKFYCGYCHHWRAYPAEQKRPRKAQRPALCTICVARRAEAKANQ